MATNATPVMLIIWAALALITGILYAYRTSLTRDEEDQLFLDDAFNHEKAHQEAILAKVHRIEPAIRVSVIATVAMTVVVIGYHGWFAARSLF
ncbi:MAG TPA: hypothetical protein VIM62_08920 [Acidobacteriaceae bacterium]